MQIANRQLGRGNFDWALGVQSGHFEKKTRTSLFASICGCRKTLAGLFTLDLKWIGPAWSEQLVEEDGSNLCVGNKDTFLTRFLGDHFELGIWSSICA